jgi:hypothetical protein
MKNVLVLYYTQSGQLGEIANSFTSPLIENKDVTTTFCEIKLKNPFPFPWDNQTFFNAFPESFLEIPSEIEPIADEILNQNYDLVILAYQIWFLSVSIPVNSFLKSSYAAQLLKNTPVVTLIGCRNMWIMAHEKMKKQLLRLEAKLVGNVVLVDRAPNLISVITIVKWMFSGKKKKYWGGLLPKPGVSDRDIQNAKEFGKVVNNALAAKNFQDLQNQLIDKKAVRIDDYLVTVEARGSKIFSKWAHFIITKKKSRNLWLKAFNVYLFLAIWIISPIVYILHILMYPFTKKGRLNRKFKYQSVHLQ